MTQTEDTVSDHQDVGADAGGDRPAGPGDRVPARSHPEAEPEPGPTAPEVAGGEDDPGREGRRAEDQPGRAATPRAAERGPDSSDTRLLTPPTRHPAASAGVSRHR